MRAGVVPIDWRRRRPGCSCRAIRASTTSPGCSGPTRDTLLVQQLNRLQNTDRYLLADAATGSVRDDVADHDDAFITIGFGGLPEARPLRGGGEFLVTSEKDGWMHVYRVTRDGRETLVTRGAMDAVADGRRRRDARGCVYFVASPANATQRYLYRAPLDGSSRSRARHAAHRSPARIATPSRPTDDLRSTASPASTILASASSSACPTTKSIAVVDDNADAEEETRAAAHSRPSSTSRPTPATA